MDTSNRLARVGVSFELMLDIMREDFDITGRIQCTNGIPKDAEYVRSYIGDNDVVYFVFSHPAFAPLVPGDEIPEISVKHKHTKYLDIT
jgi:hypothetical protein